MFRIIGIVDWKCFKGNRFSIKKGKSEIVHREGDFYMLMLKIKTCHISNIW